MRAAAAALLLLVSGCAGSLVDYPPRVHVVQPGETLSRIAAAYGLDHRELARWNRLPDPDFIYVGQRIRLLPPSDARRPAAAGASASIPRRDGLRSAAPAEPRERAAGQPSSRPSISVSRPSAIHAAAPVSGRWRWPASGPLIGRFGSSRGIATGIAIGGQVGEPVEAAAGGRVVYAGSGLIGYGQLVIIRHDELYLSAYGHNRRLLVEQGDSVEQGQKVAEMGLGPDGRPRLHFEIRREGSPVDPLAYLPRKP